MLKVLKDFLVSTVYAEGETAPASTIGSWTNPGLFSSDLFGDNPTLAGTFVAITNILIFIGIGLVLVFLVLGFIRFITSQGDKVATEQAQKWVTYAIIGGVGLFLVYAVKSVLLNFLNVNDPLAVEPEE
ncbi:MAG TPA: hypothetical protein PKX33_02350 [Candidatus Paceibacterota bacterium]|nr:hypothetical protein [Candidatus Paceibacterota bacterium]